ncbi:MAG: DUF4296 domain-containing protein [Flavisolibacter sp.]|nr:DUF4296 domain-containing protein [Flavisolibacter sp.]
MRFIVILLLVFAFIACRSGTNVPDGILPVNKMQRVLWDMLRADELGNYRRPNDTVNKVVFDRTELYQQVFRVHHISEKDFKKSLSFYQSKPELLQVVIDSLQKKATAATTPPIVPATPVP